MEIMHTHSLFTLLGERLMMHTNTVSITTYNTLYEVWFALFFASLICFVAFFPFRQIFDHILLTALADFSLQILTEQVCTQVVHKPHPEPDSTVKIQNPSE